MLTVRLTCDRTGGLAAGTVLAVPDAEAHALILRKQAELFAAESSAELIAATPTHQEEKPRRRGQPRKDAP